MSKNYRRERAWIWKKIKKGVKQDELRESVGIFSNRKKKFVMEQKKISAKQYAKRKELLGNAYVLLCNERFQNKTSAKPRLKTKPATGIIPRTEKSAFRSRDYTREELNSLYDDIDSINF